MLLALTAFVVVGGLTARRKLQSNHLVGNAKVFDCYSGGKGNPGYWVDYYIVKGGKKFRGASHFNEGQIRFNGLQQLVGRYMPVVYNPDDPRISYLLVLPEDFKRYDLSYPDSLAWLQEYQTE
jgi:hypothetical protein